MNKKLTILAVVTVMAVIMTFGGGLALADTIYVDDSNPSCPGSGASGDPFCSIQDAIDDTNTSAGDTISVAAGTYNESVTINKSVILVGFQAGVDPAGAVYRDDPGDADESVITGTVMITADDVTLNGFKMTSSYVAVGYTHAHNVDISYNIFENVTATWGAIHLHGTASGPSYHEADGGYIGYNTISGADGDAIWTVGNNDVTIEYNHILNSTAGFASIQALNHVGTGIVIHGNTITNSWGKGINYWADDGGVITDNVISNSTYEAIFTDAQAIISGNQITGGSGYGIFVYFGADGSTLSGNTISGPSWEALRILAQATITNNNTTGGYHGVFVGSTAVGSIVSGNTILSPDWNGIVIDAPANILNNDVSGSYMGIQVHAATGTVIDGNNIHDNRFWGLSIESGVTEATVKNNQLLNNFYPGVAVWGTGDGSGIHINFNQIIGNGIYGVESNRTAIRSPVNAEYNWWGDVSGPYNPLNTDGLNQLNPEGLGDAVTEYVLYDPWIGQPGMVTGGGWIDSPEGAYQSLGDTFFNGFETDTSGWFTTGGNITRVASGTNGVTSADGNWHAEIAVGPNNGDGAFTKFGGYSNVFPAGELSQLVDVYIDPAMGSIGNGWALDNALNGNDGDWEEAGGVGAIKATDGNWWLAADGDGGGYPGPASGGVGLMINTAGWYTIESQWVENSDDPLEIDRNTFIYDSNGTLLYSNLNLKQVFLTDAGGHRYGWFLDPNGPDWPPIQFPLPIDNSRLTQLVKPTGKATFGFVAKNKKTQTPDGNTVFMFKAADLNFHSNDYEWLVVNKSESRAQFKGTGTINGEGDYKFMLWATDGDPDNPDTFRIKIWEEDEDSNETVIYDNGSNQPIGGGSIVVHTNKK